MKLDSKLFVYYNLKKYLHSRITKSSEITSRTRVAIEDSLIEKLRYNSSVKS
jgi:hypothetical protein